MYVTVHLVFQTVLFFCVSGLLQILIAKRALSDVVKHIQ